MKGRIIIAVFIGLLSVVYVHGAKVESQSGSEFFNPLAIFSGIGSLFDGVTKGIQNIFETFIKEIIPPPIEIDPKYNIQDMSTIQEDIVKNLPIIENDLNSVGEVVNEMAVGASIGAAKGLKISQSVLKPDTSDADQLLKNLKSVEGKEERKKTLKEVAKAKSKDFLEALTKPSSIVSDYTAPIIVIQAPETDATEVMKINDIIKCRGGDKWLTLDEHHSKMKEYRKFKGKKRGNIEHEIEQINKLIEERDEVMTGLRNQLRVNEVRMAEKPSDVATLENKLLKQQMGYIADEIVVLDRQLGKLHKKNRK
ncbi:hypothetical protein FG386_000665 [Cryptosporidium ryanae]|uniref:uncharacterized protein n=1 Tax=Cryptosporidium ryanae TaxID=515981 RepID=UPI00351A7DB7|nr:hypothetical protein FG386_000665 [Cryptosporidium ryanae]